LRAHCASCIAHQSEIGLAEQQVGDRVVGVFLHARRAAGPQAVPTPEDVIALRQPPAMSWPVQQVDRSRGTPLA